jgi:hypothetical protein
MTTPDANATTTGRMDVFGTAIAGLAGAGFVLLSLFVAWLLVVIGGMACDETCDDGAPPSGADWDNYRDAWQWTGLTVTGYAIALLAIVSAGLVAHQRRNMAVWPVAGHAVASMTALAIMQDGIVGAAALVASTAGVVMLLGAQRSFPKRRPVSENPSAL